MTKNKAILIILDGWGLSPITEGNAPFLAKTPVLDKVYANYPKIALSASGLEVGLSVGEPGNSEVGHLNLGSGRVVWEMLPKIDQSIARGEFFELPVLRDVSDYLKKNKGRLHLIGLGSTGGVHSHLNHLFALLDYFAGEHATSSAFLHLFTDGRDTGPKEAINFIDQIEKKLSSIRFGKIASLIGRYYGMDRDNNWDRVKKAYDLITQGAGSSYSTAREAIEKNYAVGKGDEYLEASIVDVNGIVKPNDAVIFFNFREDRAKQLLEAFEIENFKGFKREKINNLFLASMTSYFEEEESRVIFLPNDLKNVLADIVESHGLRQYHTAETEKYAHVTYFFNGGSHRVHQFEKQVLVPSPKVSTYDNKPEMSADGVTENVVEAIKTEQDLILVNYANGDMVGHTGVLPAAIKAVEYIDSCLQKVLVEASKFGYKVLITADHGNCEMMLDPVSGGPYTEHTTSLVPLSYLDLKSQPFSLNLPQTFSKEDLVGFSSSYPQGIIADISPTILDIMGLEKPREMICSSLLSALE
jgi:2,3-bisphosphoglycerate-independent phosphoglycerate mutase